MMFLEQLTSQYDTRLLNWNDLKGKTYTSRISKIPKWFKLKLRMSRASSSKNSSFRVRAEFEPRNIRLELSSRVRAELELTFNSTRTRKLEF